MSIKLNFNDANCSKTLEDALIKPNAVIGTKGSDLVITSYKTTWENRALKFLNSALRFLTFGKKGVTTAFPEKSMEKVAAQIASHRIFFNNPRNVVNMHALLNRYVVKAKPNQKEKLTNILNGCLGKEKVDVAEKAIAKKQANQEELKENFEIAKENLAVARGDVERAKKDLEGLSGCLAEKESLEKAIALEQQKIENAENEILEVDFLLKNLTVKECKVKRNVAKDKLQVAKKDYDENQVAQKKEVYKEANSALDIANVDLDERKARVSELRDQIKGYEATKELATQNKKIAKSKLKDLEGLSGCIAEKESLEKAIASEQQKIENAEKEILAVDFLLMNLNLTVKECKVKRNVAKDKLQVAKKDYDENQVAQKKEVYEEANRALDIANVDLDERKARVSELRDKIKGYEATKELATQNTRIAKSKLIDLQPEILLIKERQEILKAVQGTLAEQEKAYAEAEEALKN